MKLVKLLTLLMIFGNTACTKNPTSAISLLSSEGHPGTDAVILGADLRMCACCGGYSIAIKGKNYDFDKAPSGSNVNLSTSKFPLKVKVDYTVDSPGCGNRITLTALIQ